MRGAGHATVTVRYGARDRVAGDSDDQNEPADDEYSFDQHPLDQLAVGQHRRSRLRHDPRARRHPIGGIDVHLRGHNAGT